MQEYIHVENFWKRAAQDPRLHPAHLVMYLALCQVWSAQGCVSPFQIQRQELMGLAKIRSRVTYHRHMRELHRYGYIRYAPSYNYYQGSFVTMVPLKGKQLQQEEVPNFGLK